MEEYYNNDKDFINNNPVSIKIALNTEENDDKKNFSSNLKKEKYDAIINQPKIKKELIGFTKIDDNDLIHKLENNCYNIKYYSIERNKFISGGLLLENNFPEYLVIENKGRQWTIGKFFEKIIWIKQIKTTKKQTAKTIKNDLLKKDFEKYFELYRNDKLKFIPLDKYNSIKKLLEKLYEKKIISDEFLLE